MSKCDYCRGVGACPKCWGRANITELQARLAEAVALLRKLSGPLAEEAEMRAAGGDTPYSLSLDALTDEVDTFLAGDTARMEQEREEQRIQDAGEAFFNDTGD